MRPSFVTLTQHIEQKQVHIIEQRLVIQEQLRQVAQILAKELLLLAVNLKHGHVGIAVDLVPRRMLYSAALEMLQHLLALLEEHQVVLTEIEHLQQHAQLIDKPLKKSRRHWQSLSFCSSACFLLTGIRT